MGKLLMFFLIFVLLNNSNVYSQKKYGYAVIYFKCSNEEALKTRIYYSPVIELNILNFNKYLDGIDPDLPKYLVRYYNYAICKWFERYLLEHYHLVLNDPENHARKSRMLVFNESGNCNPSKTKSGCFSPIKNS